jgi:hypothetical protein
MVSSTPESGTIKRKGIGDQSGETVGSDGDARSY